MADRVPEPGNEPIVGAAASSPAGSPRWRSRVLFDWMFRSRQTGKVTAAQLPNLALWIFLVTVVLRRVVPAGTWVRSALDWSAAVALAWWALDEVLRGVNPWRRLLGLAGCAAVVTEVARLMS
jgi:hypothetical protein